MSMLSGLTTSALGHNYLEFESLDSTNDFLKNSAVDSPHGTVVAAKKQTAGKGRQGKQWESPTGQTLSMSVLIHNWPVHRMGLLPLLAGVAVCEALEHCCGVQCRVKWSNDVLLHSKKICGILCESRLSASGAFAVIGIGINLVQTEQWFERHDLVYATSLQMATGESFSARELTVAVLNFLEPMLDPCCEYGIDSFRSKYLERCITVGQDVRVLQNNIWRTGAATGIDDSGALICEIDGKTELITAGDASVRGIFGYGN